MIAFNRTAPDALKNLDAPPYINTNVDSTATKLSLPLFYFS